MMLGILSVLLQINNYFKYKSSILEKAAANGVLRNAKITVLLKYLSNFRRSLELPLINCKIHLGSNWNENCVISDNNDDTIFKIQNRKFP